MKKLKLESLEVASFVTSPEGAQFRGTMHGHAAIDTGAVVVGPVETGPVQTGPSQLTPSIFRCGPTDTAYDCTFTCTHFGPCESRYICVAEPSEPAHIDTRITGQISEG